MVNDDFERLFSQRHTGITLFDFDGKKVPCIILDEKRFDDMMKSIAGKPFSVETNLNILQDGMGHVFVNMTLNFSQGDIEEKVLLYANESLEFFEALANNSMLALSSPHSQYGGSNVFMIQLPRAERTSNALEMIKKGLKA